MYSQKWNCAAYIHVSVCDLHIPRICMYNWCSKIGRPFLWICKLLTETWIVEIGRQNIIIMFWKYNEAAQFHFWKNTIRNQTFILDSHQPFIYSVGGLPDVFFRWSGFQWWYHAQINADRVIYRAYWKRFSELVFNSPLHVKQMHLNCLTRRQRKIINICSRTEIKY